MLVVACVTTEVSCQAVAFTNPVGNPTVDLAYGPAGASDEPGEGDLTLKPGETRRIRTNLARVSYFAYVETDRTASLAGESDGVTVPQNCVGPTPVPGDGSLTTYGLAGCTTKSKAAKLDLSFDRLRGINMHFEIRAGKTVVATGNSTKKDRVSATVGKSGTYHYRSYVNGSASPYEDVSFTVYRCVKTTVTCHHVTFIKPIAARVEILYSGNSGKTIKNLRVGAKSSKRIRWTKKHLTYYAFVDVKGGAAQSNFQSSAGSAEKLKTHTC